MQNRFLFPVLGLYYYEFVWRRTAWGELVFVSTFDATEVVYA
jgi:hypothetical protein